MAARHDTENLPRVVIIGCGSELAVIGDLAALPWHQPPVPGTAPAAKQMGRHAAKNILRRLKGEEAVPFRYRDLGMLATIGRNAAVAVFGRIVVLIDWAIAYWTFDRHARIVTGRPR